MYDVPCKDSLLSALKIQRSLVIFAPRLVGTFDAIYAVEVRAFGVPHEKHTFFSMVHFKHIPTRYAKALLLAILVQRCAHLARDI